MKRDVVMIDVCYIMNRVTGEVAFVELGAKYDQSIWEYIGHVDRPELV